MNNKLRQLIRESINEYIREIDEAGNVAALEAKMAKTQEAIETREKKVNMEGIDEAYHDMLDKGKLKELGNEIKALKKSLAKYEKQLEKLKNKGKKSEEPKEETEKEIVDEVNIDENFPEAGPELEETELNESFLHMQKLAGLITEAEYRQKKSLIENQLTEIENLSSQEKKIVDDIVSAGMLEESKFDLKAILDKMVQWGKKGLLTLGIISAVLASCNVDSKDMMDVSKEQYETAVRLAKEDSAYAAKQGKTFNVDSAALAHYDNMAYRNLKEHKNK